MSTYTNPTLTVYLHLETDEEFLARLRAQVPKVLPYVSDLRGADLDDYVWNSCHTQRKLIEVIP